MSRPRTNKHESLSTNHWVPITKY